ncbi:MAG: hypothetical protein KA077_02075 [Veillonella sp.]|nr:hypothetical protein [Veillonella sp.]MBP9624265.1 hypothetical protein [Veillonella sp.]
MFLKHLFTKTLLMAFGLIILTFPAFAMSLSELQDNPTHYTVTYADNEETEYVDNYSIESKPDKNGEQWAKATIYIVSPQKSWITQYTNLYSYDLTNKTVKWYPLDILIFNFNGSIIDDMKIKKTASIQSEDNPDIYFVSKPNSPSYNSALFVYSKLYLK